MAIFTFPHLFLLAFFIIHVGRRLFVDAVVGEVGEEVLHLGALVGVLVGGEPHEAVVIEVQPQGVNRGHQQIQAEVKLGLVNKVRPRHVSTEGI